MVRLAVTSTSAWPSRTCSVSRRRCGQVAAAGDVDGARRCSLGHRTAGLPSRRATRQSCLGPRLNCGRSRLCLCPSPTGRPSVRRAGGRGSPAAPPRRRAFRRDRDRREEQPTGRPSCTRGPARLARRTSGWPRRGQPVRVPGLRPWAAAQPGRRLWGGVGVVAAAHAGPPSRAATTPRPSSPPRSPRAEFGRTPQRSAAAGTWSPIVRPQPR